MVKSATAEKVADDTLSDIFFKILAHRSVSIAPVHRFPQKGGHPRFPVFCRNEHLGAIETER